MGNLLVEYMHRTQKKPDIEAILLSWVLNLVPAFFVFNLSWWLTENVIVTVIYTLAGWTITLSMSIAFWLSWIFNRMKTKEMVRTSMASIVIFMYVIGLYIIWSTFIYVFALFI